MGRFAYRDADGLRASITRHQPAEVAMPGTCETCHWWQDEERNGEPVERIAHPAGTEVQKVCIWLPVHQPTPPLHRCGQHKPAEQLCGGVDRRPQAWGKA